MASEIQVYGTDWCRLTFAVREYLTNSRLDHDFFDIERNPRADEFVRSINGGNGRYPIVVTADTILTNPTRKELQQMIEQYHLRPVRPRRNGSRPQG